MLIEQIVMPGKPVLVAAPGKSRKTDALAFIAAEAAKKLLG
jgi:hypothetical protein